MSHEKANGNPRINAISPVEVSPSIVIVRMLFGSVVLRFRR